MAAILFPVLIIFGSLTGNFTQGYLQQGNYIIFSIIFSVIVIFNHRSNIKRIMEGTESRISFKSKKDKNVENKIEKSQNEVVDSEETNNN